MSKNPQPNLPEYDLFISYSPADREWVEGYLLDALSTANVRVLSELNFALGAPRLSEFERAIKSSKRTLLVLSPAYMAEAALQFVDVIVQNYGLESGTWPVIPLLLKPVELPPRLAILVSLDATDPQNWADAIDRLCSTLQAGPPAPAAKPLCPYPGMRAFREQETSHFYGREAEVEELVQRLRRHPFVAVIGPSGSGKSSLVNAGLVPALRRSSLFGAGEWLVRTMRPGAQPMAELMTALGTTDMQQFTPAALLATEQGATRLLLVVDQFEEVFTQGSSQKEEFLATIQRLTSLRDCFAVITVRADFFADLLTSPLWPSIQAHRLEIAPLGEQGLRVAILKPAEDMGVFVESALVERLVASSTGQPGLLPFVQEVMVRLWEKLERRYLPLRAYETLVLPLAGYSGSERTGIQAAMAQLADEIIHSLRPEQQRIAQRIFVRLVQFGEGRADTRRQQPVSALVAVGDDATLFDETLKYLAENRLLVLSGEEGSESRVDLAHEAMLTGWPLLEQWIKEGKAAELTRRRLEAKAAEWVRLGQGEGGLLDKAELREAEEFFRAIDGKEMGTSSELLDLIAISKRTINPGWHPRGVLGLVTVALSLVALVSLVFLLLPQNLFPSPWLLTMCSSALVLFVVAGIAFGLLRRADRFVLQRWTQAITEQRMVQVGVIGMAGAIVVLWAVIGIRRAIIAQQCAEAGFDRHYSQELAVLNANIETPYAALFAAQFQRASRNRLAAQLTLPTTAELCRSYIDYKVVLQEEGRDTPDALYIARIEGGGKREVVQSPTKVGCRAMLVMPYEILGRLGFTSGEIAEPLTDPSALSCAAVLAYEEGYQYQQRTEWMLAERKYQEAIAEYYRYVEAHMNLGVVLQRVGRAQEAVKELRIAVAVIDRPSGEVLKELGAICYYAEDLDCAKKAFEDTLDTYEATGEAENKDSINLYGSLGVIYRELHQYDRSAVMFSKFEALLPLDKTNLRRNQIALAKNRGILAFYLGDMTAAERYLQAADNRQRFSLLDRIGQMITALIGQDVRQEMTQYYQRWNEEIVYYLARVTEINGSPKNACAYLARYKLIPTSNLYQEGMRRTDAPKRAKSLGCSN